MKVQVAQLCPTLCDPMVFTVHGILQARILEWVAFPFSRGSSQPGTEPTSLMSPALAGGFFTTCATCESESHSVVSDSLRPHGLYSSWNPSGQNTGVGRLSLLQGIFPTQGLNPGLPHCRQILYQLSHKGSVPSVGISKYWASIVAQQYRICLQCRRCEFDPWVSKIS